MPKSGRIPLDKKLLDAYFITQTKIGTEAIVVLSKANKKRTLADSAVLCSVVKYLGSRAVARKKLMTEAMSMEDL